MNIIKWVGIGLAIWVAVSIPTALILGRFLRARNQQLPTADERLAQQAGEQR